MDTTLTQGLLTRLDAVTAQMGVAASEVWGIWIATSWRPMAGACFGLALSFLAIVIGGRLIRLGIKKDDELIFLLGSVPFAVAAVAVLINLSNLPDAFAYLMEPRLYAIDQLRGLLGK